MRPPSTASAALNAPPSSSITNEVSAKSTPSRRAWSAMHSATLATLSAVPRSMRFHLRYAGIVGRWIAPGPNTSGSPAAMSARTIERIPPTPTRPCGSSSRSSSMSASSRSPTCSTGTSGSP